MEALGAAGSIIAILELSSKVISYTNSARGAKDARKALRDEVKACRNILQDIKDDSDDSEEGQHWAATVKALEGPDGPLGRLRIVLIAIVNKLTRPDGIGTSLKWPFKEKEAKELVASVEREKALLLLAVGNNTRQLVQKINQTCRDNATQLTAILAQHTVDLAALQSSGDALQRDIGSLAKRHDTREELEERQVILDWLATEEYIIRRNDILSQRQKGTGQWLLETPEFKTWSETSGSICFCPGIPGAGKTFLSTTVIENLLNQSHNATGGKQTGVAYFYCRYNQQNEQTIGLITLTLLRQLADGFSPLPDCVKSLFQQHLEYKTKPRNEEVLSVLQSVCRLYPMVSIVIDALDEYGVATGQQDRMASEILHVQQQCGFSLFATSREIAAIVEVFKCPAESPQGAKTTITLPIRAHESDVRLYLDDHISQLPGFVQRSPSLKEEVKTAIVEAVDGMFLLAKLHMDSLVAKRSKKALQIALKGLPSGSNAYYEAYDDAMERIESQLPEQSEMAKNVLKYVVCWKDLITVIELQHALAVELDTTEFDQDNIPDAVDMISVCAGLVTVEEESQHVRVAHYTTQEYFDRRREHWFPQAQLDITALCCTYLSYNELLRRYETRYSVDQGLHDYPLYEYAASFWGIHAHEAGSPCQQVIDFLHSDARVKSSSQLLDLYGIAWPVLNKAALRLSGSLLFALGCHQAAMFGLCYAISSFSDNILTLVSDYTSGYTPLHFAVLNGQESVVRQLLKVDRVRSDLSEYISSGILHDAAGCGYQDIVKMLLDSFGLDPNGRDDQQRTALHHAAKEGHEAIVSLLLNDSRVEIDLLDENGDSPLLSAAAANANPCVVQLLLATARVEIDRPKTDTHEQGRTALSFAAEKGWTSLVSQLLATGTVNTDSIGLNQFNEDRTPLSFASERGHLEVVQILLDIGKVAVDSGSDLNHLATPDRPGTSTLRTPLSFASRNGHENVVKMLIAEGANLNSADHLGRTALWMATEKGHIDVVKLLIANGADVNLARVDLQTPLSCASELGREDIIKMLISAGAYINLRITYGRTLLSMAVENGHEHIIKLLLDKGADINFTDYDGRTPLLHAAWRGRSSVVRLLLAVPGINAGQPLTKGPSAGRNSLSLVAELGNLDVVKMLLSHGVDPNKQDKQGRTALSWAASESPRFEWPLRDRESVVRELLQAGAQFDLEDDKGRSPLWHAIKNHQQKIAALLLGAGAKDISQSG